MKKSFLLKLLGLMVLLVPILFKSLNIIESINATILVITILLGIAILVMGDYLQKKKNEQLILAAYPNLSHLKLSLIF